MRAQIYRRECRAHGEDLAIIGSGGSINKLYKMAADKDRERESFTVEELSPDVPLDGATRRKRAYMRHYMVCAR